MRIVRNIIVLAALVIGGPSMAFAEDSHDAHGGSDKASSKAERAVGSQLPPKLRALLIQEMLALADASKQILDGLVRGQDEVVARNAQGMHDSFILAQEMSDADRQAFHDALPHAFVERDQAFHELTEQLAEAAREGNQGEQRELFSEILNTCVACHTEHATDRFPGLSAGKR